MDESKYYKFDIHYSTHIDLITSYNAIFLCAYKINLNGKLPFLQYLLVNNVYELSLPKINLYKSINKDNWVSYSKVHLSGLLQCDDYDFEQFSNDISFNGCYEYNNNIYLFFDLTKCEIYENIQVKFGLIDEIVNHTKIVNIFIDYSTVQFFINHDKLLYLYDKQNKPYETPIVGFVGKTNKQQLNFGMIFGECASDKSAILGPYFYFTNFCQASRQSYGVIRFALFAGKMKYIENYPNDIIDNSDIKKKRMNDVNLDKNKEIQTLRISDHDGLWSKMYDSAYLGKLELDDGTLLDNVPLIVLKKYTQQLPLSIYKIDLFNNT
jgi:hypothetical protein